MLGPRVQSSGTQVPAVGNPPGFTRSPRRGTLTTQVFTREPNRVLWPRATLRLLQGTSQPVLWPGATLRLFTHFYKANHDNPSQPRQPKITRVLLPIWGYFRRRNLRTSFLAKNGIGAAVPRGRASVPPSWVTNVEGLGHKVRTQVRHLECVARSISS